MTTSPLVIRIGGIPQFIKLQSVAPHSRDGSRQRERVLSSPRSAAGLVIRGDEPQSWSPWGPVKLVGRLVRPLMGQLRAPLQFRQEPRGCASKAFHTSCPVAHDRDDNGKGVSWVTRDGAETPQVGALT